MLTRIGYTAPSTNFLPARRIVEGERDEIRDAHLPDRRAGPGRRQPGGREEAEAVPLSRRTLPRGGRRARRGRQRRAARAGRAARSLLMVPLLQPTRGRAGLIGKSHAETALGVPSAEGRRTWAGDGRYRHPRDGVTHCGRCSASVRPALL